MNFKLLPGIDTGNWDIPWINFFLLVNFLILAHRCTSGVKNRNLLVVEKYFVNTDRISIKSASEKGHGLRKK